MPAKLDRCVKSVMRKGKDSSSAYAICSKSTGYVKTGPHSWVNVKEKTAAQFIESNILNDAGREQ